MIYFVCPADGGPIKIGYADHFGAQMTQLARELGTPPCVLGIIPGGPEREVEIHERFARLGAGAGWFRPGFALLRFIAAESRPWTGAYVDCEGDTAAA